MNTKILLLNIGGLVLLCVAIVAIVFMPRVNYERFFDSQERLRQEFLDLKDKTDNCRLELKSFSELVSTSTELNQSHFERFTESLRKLGARVDILERQTSKASFVLPAGETKELPSPEQGTEGVVTFSNLGRFFGESYTDDIELPAEVEEKLGNTSIAGMIVQNGFDSFLQRMIEDKLLPFDTIDNMSAETQEDLREIFESFEAHVKLISQQESLNTAMLVQLANETGDYEERLDAPEDRRIQRENRPKRPSGITVVSPRLDGKRREYFFSYDEHPEMKESEALQAKVKRHLYRDIYLLGQRQSK